MAKEVRLRNKNDVQAVYDFLGSIPDEKPKKSQKPKTVTRPGNKKAGSKKK